MTDDTPGTTVATANSTNTTVGMEDVGMEDLVVPRLTIDHKKGVLVDGLTKQEFGELEVVMLGLVKQRVLWDTTDDFSDVQPLCKSWDFQIGKPDVTTFPWDASGFKQADFPQEEVGLDCASCILKEWETHPKREKIPWCTEQWVFPLFMPLGDGEAGVGGPAILTLQRSQLTPTRNYVTAFARSKQPMYEVFTKITLKQMSRGSVDYAVPSFQKLGHTDENLHAEFAAQYFSIRDYVTTPRVRKDDNRPAVTAATPTTASGDEAEIPF